MALEVARAEAAAAHSAALEAAKAEVLTAHTAVLEAVSVKTEATEASVIEAVKAEAAMALSSALEAARIEATSAQEAAVEAAKVEVGTSQSAALEALRVEAAEAQATALDVARSEAEAAQAAAVTAAVAAAVAAAKAEAEGLHSAAMEAATAQATQAARSAALEAVRTDVDATLSAALEAAQSAALEAAKVEASASQAATLGFARAEAEREELEERIQAAEAACADADTKIQAANEARLVAEQESSSHVLAREQAEALLHVQMTARAAAEAELHTRSEMLNAARAEAMAAQAATVAVSEALQAVRMEMESAQTTLAASKASTVEEKVPPMKPLLEPSYSEAGEATTATTPSMSSHVSPQTDAADCANAAAEPAKGVVIAPSSDTIGARAEAPDAASQGMLELLAGRVNRATARAEAFGFAACTLQAAMADAIAAQEMVLAKSMAEARTEERARAASEQAAAMNKVMAEAEAEAQSRAADDRVCALGAAAEAEAVAQTLIETVAELEASCAYVDSAHALALLAASSEAPLAARSAVLADQQIAIDAAVRSASKQIEENSAATHAAALASKIEEARREALSTAQAEAAYQTERLAAEWEAAMESQRVEVAETRAAAAVAERQLAEANQALQGAEEAHAAAMAEMRSALAAESLATEQAETIRTSTAVSGDGDASAALPQLADAVACDLRSFALTLTRGLAANAHATTSRRSLEQSDRPVPLVAPSAPTDRLDAVSQGAVDQTDLPFAAAMPSISSVTMLRPMASPALLPLRPARCLEMTKEAATVRLEQRRTILARACLRWHAHALERAEVSRQTGLASSLQDERRVLSGWYDWRAAVAAWRTLQDRMLAATHYNAGMRLALAMHRWQEWAHTSVVARAGVPHVVARSYQCMNVLIARGFGRWWAWHQSQCECALARICGCLAQLSTAFDQWLLLTNFHLLRRRRAVAATPNSAPAGAVATAPVNELKSARCGPSGSHGPPHARVAAEGQMVTTLRMSRAVRKSQNARVHEWLRHSVHGEQPTRSGSQPRMLPPARLARFALEKRTPHRQCEACEQLLARPTTVENTPRHCTGSPPSAPLSSPELRTPCAPRNRAAPTTAPTRQSDGAIHRIVSPVLVSAHSNTKLTWTTWGTKGPIPPRPYFRETASPTARSHASFTTRL